MKLSDKVIFLGILREAIDITLRLFTILNLLFIIGWLFLLYQKLFLNNEFDNKIDFSWLPFLSIPGMFVLFWLYKKIDKQYRLVKEHINQLK